MSTENYPSVTEVPDPLTAIGCRRYRLQGGDIRQDWRERCDERAEVAWCEVTIWEHNSEPGTALGSYGGTVWPSAWPEIFSVGPRTTHGQVTSLTDAGKALILAARALAAQGNHLVEKRTGAGEGR